MTILLHSNLSAIAKLVGESSRYVMSGIHVSRKGETGYRVVATNGKVLGLVEGDAGPTDEFPTIPAVETAPNGANSAIVPAAEFVKAMKDVPRKMVRAAMNCLACVIGTQQTTLASSTLDSNIVRQPRNVEGRFPNVDKVIPKTAPAVTLTFNPKFLAELLQVASEFAADGIVTIEVRGANQPLVIRASSPSQTFTGLAMPYN